MVKKSLAIAVFLLILALVLSAVLVVIAEDEDDEDSAVAANRTSPAPHLQVPHRQQAPDFAFPGTHGAYIAYTSVQHGVS